MTSQPEVNLHFSDYWRVIKTRWPIIVTLLVLVLTTAYFYSKSLPRVYSASADVQVERENKDINLDSYPIGFDAVFFQTESEIIKSQQVLNPVIEKLNLHSSIAQWSGLPEEELRQNKNNAYEIFKNRLLEIQPVRNTNLLTIICYSLDPVEAAGMANQVADSYKEYRLRKLITQGDSGLESLGEQLEEKRNIVEKARIKVERLRKLVEIPILPSSLPGREVNTSDDVNLHKMESDLVDLKKEIRGKEVIFSQISKLSISELETVLPELNVGDTSTIILLKQEHLKTKAQLKELKERGFGPSHPSVKAVNSRKKEYREQLDRLITNNKIAFELVLKSAQAEAASLEKEIEKKKRKIKEIRDKQILPFELAKSDLAKEEEKLEQLENRFERERIKRNIDANPVLLINQAEPILSPVRPNFALNMALAGVVGLVLGISLAFFIEYLDTSIKTLDDVESYLDTNVLGVVSEGVSPLNLEGPDSPNAEAYMILRAKLNLEPRTSDQGAHTLTMVSGGAGEGKSTTLFNLGFACAHSGMRTLIIDADFKRHSLDKILGISNQQGLANFLLGQGSIFHYLQDTDIPNLQIIPAGKLPPHCLGALSPAKISALIQELEPHYDLILFDSPPILGISDAAVIVHEVDSTLLVIQHRRHPRTVAWRSRKIIEEVKGRFVGVVLNKVQLRSDDLYYYYTSYYGASDYYGSIKEASKRAKINRKKLEKKLKEQNKRGSESNALDEQY